MAGGKRKRSPRFNPTLEDCEKAIDFLEDSENYGWDYEECADSLSVRIRDYPEGSGQYFLFLTWFGSEKPVSGSIPIPPGWWLDGKWFLGEKTEKYGNMAVWHAALNFEGV